MLKTIPGVLASLVILGAGAISGVWTGRWSQTRFDGPVARVQTIPMKVGDWQGHAAKLDDRTLKVAGIAGYVMRRYENPAGQAVNVLLVLGNPGPIVVHSPEICYGGAGYETAGQREKFTVEADGRSNPDAFWVTDMDKTGAAVPERLRVFYAWSDGGVWKASESPRTEFADRTVLYKLYVTRGVGPDRAGGPDQPAAVFLRAFLPELRKAVFAGR